MSVLIEGMEMPDKCGHCRFATAFECEVTKNFITTFNVRQSDCPLIEVPEPHGRTIDADALDIYQRAEAARAEYQEDEDNSYLEGMADGLCEAAKQLSVARTIIPASEEG